MIKKTITLILLLGITLFAQNSLDKYKKADAEDIETTVNIELYHNPNLSFGEGFTVSITGWEPNDSIEIFALNDTSKAYLTKNNQKLPVSPQGFVSFSISYEHKELSPGEWLIAVKGKSGLHGHLITIPEPNKMLSK